PLLTSLLDGYNVCIMAYGQTGSGKTHTMMGSQPLEEAAGTRQGIIPKAAAELFRLISEKPADSHTVEVSVTEVYNNEVFDLLATDEAEMSGNGVCVCVRVCVRACVRACGDRPASNACEVMQIIRSVLKLRAHSPTLIHTDSSRSHLIVTLTISSKSPNAVALGETFLHTPVSLTFPQCDFDFHIQPAGCRAVFRTKLQLVDLAGSECVGMSGVSGAALWEVSCINRSLSALSDVLGALAEQRPHIPYRNSKLTHLLQDVIGGDAKLLLMLCVSPTQRFISESLQSLGLGTRARQVQKEPPRAKSNALKERERPSVVLG
uniref:Kinesin motor domain-containing protein n=1 Tax=Mola mola TaxID=94237 RepID=A0A3Q4BLE1_MOLML